MKNFPVVLQFGSIISLWWGYICLSFCMGFVFFCWLQFCFVVGGHVSRRIFKRCLCIFRIHSWVHRISLINCVILIFWFEGNSMEVGFRFELFLLILSIGVWLRFCRDSVLCGADDVYNGCVHSVFLHNQICFRIFVWQWDFVLHSWKIMDWHWPHQFLVTLERHQMSI